MTPLGRTHPPNYVPAAYLSSGSFLTAPQLIAHFKDFYSSLEYIQTAPALVFERLVANLGKDFVTAVGKVQDENKDLLASNEQLKKDLAKLKSRKPVNNHENTPAESTESRKSNNPIIRSFSNRIVDPAEQPRVESSCLPFTKSYSAPPGLPMGLDLLDFGNNGNVSVGTYACNIGKDHFDIHIDSGSSAKMHQVGCTWLEVEKDDPDFQFGSFSTLLDHPSTKPQARTSELITFRPYSAPPKVVVWLTGFNMSREKTWRVRTYATNITTSSFNIHIDTWDDSVLFSAVASWIVYPSDKTDAISGTFNTSDLRSGDNPLFQHSGYVNFGNIFTSTPRTLLALNSFEMSHKRNMRLKVEATSVTSDGMIWQIDTWRDSIIYSAGASYIALG